MPLRLKIGIRWGYIIAFLMLLISYFLIFYTIRKLRTETKWITHSYQVINTLHSLKGELTDAETGVRGYFITNDKRFLDPYYSGSKNILPLFHGLRQMTRDNKNYAEEFNSLDHLINRRLTTLTDAIASYQQNNFTITPYVIASKEANKVLMDSIRLLIGQLIDQEQIVRNERTENLDSFFVSTEIITIVSLIVALITVAYSLVTYNRESNAKQIADEHAETYRKELENRINELRNVNKELKELKSIEKFASTGRIARTIAHEVRNPLTNISLASEQLKELANDNEEAEELIEMINRNASRINQLVSDLLQSTRFVQLDYQQADINQLLDETLLLAQDRIELHNIKVEKDYGKEICNIRLDKEKIKMAFLNIIVNAIEAMEKGVGVLQIKTRKENDKCVIEFRDNGSGMDEETLQRLFEPYFTSKLKGNGLGLTNTQNVILNHQGSISVHSKPGQGATFVVKLAIAKD